MASARTRVCIMFITGGIVVCTRTLYYGARKKLQRVRTASNRYASKTRVINIVWAKMSYHTASIMIITIIVIILVILIIRVVVVLPAASIYVRARKGVETSVGNGNARDLVVLTFERAQHARIGSK